MCLPGRSGTCRSQTDADPCDCFELVVVGGSDGGILVVVGGSDGGILVVVGGSVGGSNSEVLPSGGVTSALAVPFWEIIVT